MKENRTIPASNRVELLPRRGEPNCRKQRALLGREGTLGTRCSREARSSVLEPSSERNQSRVE